jgi:ribose transport system substrate-binding protein
MTSGSRGARRAPWTIALVLLFALASLTAVACGDDDDDDGGGGGSSASSGEKVKIGVSNTLVGNGWREEMICAVKAQALASGNVSEVLVHNINGGAPEQIAGIRNLISSGAKAIIINPADRAALNGVIKEADRRDIVVVAVDQAVSAPEAYVVTNDQVEYGRAGAEWLFEELGGKGKVVEMRGIEGVPADEDRHEGFTAALEKYPNIDVVKETFTGWQFANGGKQALDILNSNEQVDGIWTSGIDYTVVNAFKTAGDDYVPVVGADTNEFLNQMLTLEKDGFEGAAVTNPATIGGVGTRIALDAIAGEEPNQKTLLKPEVWDVKEDKETVEGFYDKSLPPTYSSQMTVKPYTTYTPEQLKQCKGPGES